MKLLEASEKNPNLFVFLPILHAVWIDAVLTREEIDLINSLIDSQSWLTDEEKKLIRRYIDPSTPPEPVEMKRWYREISQASEKISNGHEAGPVDIGLHLVEDKGGKVEDGIKDSLEKIEEALGIIHDEYRPSHFGKKHQSESQKLSASSSFDPKQMSKLLDGSRRKLIDQVRELLSQDDFNYVSHQDTDAYREQVLKWCRALAKQGYGSMAYPEDFGGQDDMEGYFTVMETLSYHDLSMVIKFGVQFGLFGMSVLFLGTEKHHKKHLADIGSLKLPGCFAMTETGHGSNVRGIETTATYDHQDKSFTIHTPNDLARKDYIGNAASHGQMATVFAKLMIDEVDYGVTAFLVPIRDSNSKTLPGIRIEDCGRKIGLNGVDNGRIWFDQVKIPLGNMLDRYASISEQGEFQSPITGDSRRFFTMLGTLVGGRIGIPRAGLSAAKSGLTTAIHYGDRRTQFGPENGEEVSILNYRTHQRRLMPLLANAYALHFSLQYLTNRFLNRTEEDMREIEALAAGLKSFATWNTTTTLQVCREACGGKGYLEENRLGILKNDTEIFTTFEGDNTVLMQLVAKSRLTEFKQEFHEISFFGIVNYIARQAKTSLSEMNPIIIRSTDDTHLLDPEFHLSAFRYRERDILTSAASRIKKHLDAGMNSFDAFNQCQYHLLNVGVAYTERIILEQFIKQVAKTEDESLRVVLKKLCDLFALSQIEKNKGWYLEHDYMAGVKTKAIRRMVNKLCWEVRQESVGLVDAFGISEKCLSAPIAFGDFR